MTQRLLVDATHPEETRVSLVDGNWLSDFDFERASKVQLKGNIYLAKVIRVEPSLQAAFVEYGGNRHGFLPFAEIHPDYFRIPMADRPHDEAAAEDDADDGEDDDTIEDGVVQAYAAEARELAEAEEPEEFSADASRTAAYSAEPVGLATDAAAEPAPVEFPALTENGQPAPAHAFGDEAAHDVGLITDFGHAAPIETLGGEVGEIAEVAAQRIRRQKKPNYKIQEVVKRRQVMLIQVVKEERGNKGAALTTFLSLAGRYCVLMPNTDSGGGVSRKITSHQDRRRMKEMLDQLEIPDGMAVILRTAGMEQEPAEIQRDLEYLLRLWNNIREQTLQSTAPAMIYEEASLIKRTLRDLYSREVGEILVAGDKGYQTAVDFMRTIMPDQLDKVKLYTDPVPLFFRYNVEKQIDQLYNVTVQLRSGGYIVINPTEALVSIDVNSGRATRERHIESTALKTNLEAAEEIGRQLRLRDLAGLIVIDFIDMEDGRNNAAVERRMKDSMRADRARLQIGRISPFGLLELSRQRLHPSLMEINFEKCPHCVGVGLIRSTDSAAISILRVIEEEGLKSGGGEIVLHVPPKIALYILNQKRSALSDIEKRYGLTVLLHSDEELVQPDYKLERTTAGGEVRSRGPAVNNEQVFADTNSARERHAELRNSDITAMPDAPEGRPERNRDRDGGRSEGGRGEAGRGEGGERGGRNGRGRGRYGAGRHRGERDGRGEGRGERSDRERNAGRPGSDPHQAPAYPAAAAPLSGNAENDGDPPLDDLIGATGAEAAAGLSGEAGSQDAQRRGRRRGRRGGRGRRGNGEREGGGAGGGGNGAGGGADHADRDPSTPHDPQSSAPADDGERQSRQRPPRGDRPPTDRPRGDRPPGERRPRERQDGNWRPRGGNQAGAPNGNIPPAIPVSIHDIDTTPRPSHTPAPANSGATTSQPAHRPYAVVSDTGGDDKPKGGWWRRLTGQ